MPLCTLHLISCSTTIAAFLQTLEFTTAPTLVISRVLRWIVEPTTLTVPELLHPAHPWDLLLIFAGGSGIPEFARNHVRQMFTVRVGVPSAIVDAWGRTNARLLYPRPGDVPPLTGALEAPRLAGSAQELALTAELREWLGGWDAEGKKGAVSMLNLLAFVEGKHGEYERYGKAFAETIGAKRGGTAKIVGKVVGGDEGKTKGVWDEVALAHYPSVDHFMDMLASDDYQEVNRKYRLGSLKDTCILMTSELEVPGVEKLVRGRL